MLPFAEAATSSAAAGAGEEEPERVGVLLLNLGGPETLEDVQPFLYNLFADDVILRLKPPLAPLQPLVAAIISTLRAPKVRTKRVDQRRQHPTGGGSCSRFGARDDLSPLTLPTRARRRMQP